MAGLRDVTNPLRRASEEIKGLNAATPRTERRSLPPLWERQRSTLSLAEPTDTDPSILREGWDAFLHSLGPQNIKMLGAGLRSAGTVAQNETLHGIGYRIEKWGEDLDIGRAPAMAPVEDLETALRWVSGGLGQGLGSIGAPIVTGSAGALVGAPLGPKGMVAGGVTGAFSANHLLLAGEATEQFEREGVDPLIAHQTAHAIAPFMATLDTIGLAKVLRGPARKLRQSFVSYVGRRVAQGATVESITEMAQGAIRQITAAQLTGNPDTMERTIEVLEEGIIAGMTGGVVGGAAGTVSSRRRADEKAPPKAKPEAKPESQKSGKPEKAAAAPVTPGPETEEEGDADSARDETDLPPEQPDQPAAPDPAAAAIKAAVDEGKGKPSTKADVELEPVIVEVTPPEKTTDENQDAAVAARDDQKPATADDRPADAAPAEAPSPAEPAAGDAAERGAEEPAPGPGAVGTEPASPDVQPAEAPVAERGERGADPDEAGGPAPAERPLSEKEVREKRDREAGAEIAEKTGKKIKAKPQGTAKTALPDDKPVDVEYAIVNLDDVTPSNLDDGRVNPAYPQILQPRDRSTVESESQINAMLAEFHPEQLGRAPVPQVGSPVIDETGLVESGNGRTMALRRLHQRAAAGDEKAAADVARYRKQLEAEGFDLSGVETPVLVRVRKTEMTPTQRKRFVDQSNVSLGAAMPVSGRAMKDAEQMRGIVNEYQGGPFDAQKNRKFTGRFIQEVVPANEQLTFATSEGELTALGQQRIEAALLAASYGDEKLVERLVEAKDQGRVSVRRTLLDIAPEWLRIKESIEADEIDASADITPSILDAVHILQQAEMRSKAGMKTARAANHAWDQILDWENPLIQEEAENLGVDTDRFDITKQVVSFFYPTPETSRMRGAEKVTAAFREYISHVLANTKSQPDMFAEAAGGFNVNRALAETVEHAAERDKSEQQRRQEQYEKDRAAGIRGTVDELREQGRLGEAMRQGGDPVAAIENDPRWIGVLENALETMAPGILLETPARIDTPQGPARGRFREDERRAIIEVSRTQSRKQMRQTLRHEVIHALRSRGLFTDAEWSTLTETAARENWMDKWNIQERYPFLMADGEPTAAALEEAIADEFAAWHSDSRGYPGPVARLFERIRQFFIQVARSLRLLGHTAGDVFSDIDAGVVGSRAWRREYAARAAQGERRQIRPAFYSHLERIVRDGPGRADAKNWWTYITSPKKGVRQKEIEDVVEWAEGFFEADGPRRGMTLKGWLDSQSGPIKKDAVQAFLAANMPQIDVVEYGGPSNDSIADSYFSAIDWSEPEILVPAGSGKKYSTWKQTRGRVVLTDDAPHWTNELRIVRTTMVGGNLEPSDTIWLEQYKNKTTWERFGASRQVSNETELNNLSRDLVNQYFRQWVNVHRHPENSLQPRYDEYVHPGEPNDYREILIVQKQGPKRQGPHWYEQDVILHIRASTRPTPLGEKTFFIEEIQSDEHQDTSKIIRAAEERLASAEASLEGGRWVGWHAEYLGDREVDPVAAHQEIAKYKGELTDAREKELAFSGSSNWVRLALKQVIETAVQEGHDAIMWADGPSMVKMEGNHDAVAGMTKFYEGVLPNTLKAYLKKQKWDAPISERTWVEGEIPSHWINDIRASAQEALYEAEEAYEMNADPPPREHFETEEEWMDASAEARDEAAREAVAEKFPGIGFPLSEDENLHQAVLEYYNDGNSMEFRGFGIKIPEKMREDVLAEGQPKYQLPPSDEKPAPVEPDYPGQPELTEAKRRATKAAVEEAEKRAENPSPEPLINLLRPMESFFRVLTVPLGGLDANGDMRLTKPLQRAATYVIRDMRPGPDSAMPWLDRWLERSRHAWLNRYGTPREFIVRERQRHTESFEIMQELVEHLKTLSEAKVGVEESRALQEVLEGKELTDDRINRLAAPIREAIDRYGLRLVELGLLPKEAYRRNLGKYLHRSYARYEFDQPALVRWGRQRGKVRRAALRGDELMRRGRTHQFKIGQLLRDVPEAMRKKAREAKKWEILDLKSEGGRVRRRVYWPKNIDRSELEKALPAIGTAMRMPNLTLDQLESQGTWEVRRQKNDPDAKGRQPTAGRPYLWRDWSKAERAEMGEIRDARYNLIKTYELLAHDIASGAFFEDVSKNPAWFSKKKPDGVIVDGAEVGRFYSTVAGVDWVKVPKAKIAKSAARRWGAIAGGYVRAPLWRDMIELEKMQNPGHWGWLLREWKKNKALALDTPIPTPSGWTTMGAIAVGDTVFDEKGQPCTVEEVRDIQHGRPCYEVAFSDGATIIADDEHWWFVTGRNNPDGKVLTTAEIRDTLTYSRGDRNHSVPVARALNLTDAELPLPPYALGLWLGDGHAAGPRITVGARVVDEIVELLRAAGVFSGAKVCDIRSSAVTFTIDCQPVRVGNKPNKFKEGLKELGVLGSKAIPQTYLRGSISQRLALLRGLLDSDGWIAPDGVISGFATSSPALRAGVTELLRSLGYKPTTREFESASGKPAWRIQFSAYADTPVFGLKAKLERLRPPPARPQRSSTRQIVGVTKVDSVPVRCIAVSSKSHLYLAGDGMIPTHNTARSPTVHFNNTIGNVILSELYDFTPADIYRGIKEFATRGSLYREAVSEGIFSSGYVQVELDKIDVDGVIEKAKREAEAAEGIEQGTMQRLFTLFKTLDRGMQSAYRFEDEVFRLVSYMKDRGRGMNRADAAQNAIDRFLNYDIRAPIPNALRRSILPFMSYTYAFIPQWLSAVSRKPWKVAKIFALGYMLEQLAYEIVPGDEDEERRVMSDRDTGWTWAGLPKTLRTPFKVGDDPVMIGLTRVLPGGGLADMDKGQIGLPEWMLVSGPILMAGEVVMNRISYTGQDMVDEVDTIPEANWKRFKYLYRATLPNAPWIPGSWDWNRMAQAVTDERDVFGRQYSPAIAAVRMLGPKVFPYDVDTEFGRRMWELKRSSELYRQKLWELQLDRSRNRISEWRYQQGVTRIQDGLSRLGEKAREIQGR